MRCLRGRAGDTWRKRLAPQRFFLIALAVLLSGCVTTSFHTSEELKRGGDKHRILLMPVDVELSEIQASGVPLPKAEWTRAAKEYISQSLRDNLRDVDAELIIADETVSLSGTDWHEVQLVKLHGAVGMSIALHQYQGPLKLPTKKDTFEWTIGPDARFLRKKYKADYALFVFLRDSYVSGGRVAVMVAAALLGVSMQGGMQVGFASLVDLETGEVVWFNRLIRGTGDLRTTQAADKSVLVLLENFPK